MKKIFKALTARISPVWIAAAALLLLAGGFFFFSRGETTEETLVVVRGEFVQEVSVSGKVVAAEQVDLAFSETGRVGSIAVEVGDTVAAGQSLANLSIDALASDLRAAQVDLQEITKEQNALVASTYRDLLSEGLVAVPNSASYTAQAPVITGLYEGPEGVYRVRIERKGNSEEYELHAFNLEESEVEVLKNAPTALGTRGLFISFSDPLMSYRDTTWQIAIPNTKSSSYLQNYNAYQEAQRGREKAIAQAEAAIANIRTDIAQRTLRAPFAGVVTAVAADVGAIVGSNELVLSLIGAESLQIESFVPEINLSLVKAGTPAAVTLDAYGSEVVFAASVVSVDPAETVRDGVSTYRAVLRFDKQDERVRSGMTANVRITADRREGIISIPQGVVISRDGKKFVPLKVGEETQEREVTTGAVSSLGSIEITSGLSEGDVVILSH